MLHYFTDPVLRAPTLGAMFMCAAAGLVGVIFFLRKQSLLGEALSHAAYPGVILGVILAALLGFSDLQEASLTSFILWGAFVTALAGLFSIYFLENRLKIHSDAALCLILALFYGVGVLLASHVQFTLTNFYRQVQVYLYGQAATMTDIYILIYALLLLVIGAIIWFFYKEFQLITFDRNYAQTIGIPTQFLDGILFILIVSAIVIGIRSVGVVLMSAMLVAPAAAARQFTHHFSKMLLLAMGIGAISGFLGNYFSIELGVSLPTGPMIVLSAAAICFLAILFAPQRGILWRMVRTARFRSRCQQENILKAIWRLGQGAGASLEHLKRLIGTNSVELAFNLWRLRVNGWLTHRGAHYELTPDGINRAAKIVRLHRLWEVYLVDYLGMGAEKVHRSAEEMEHILTPELERELTLLLKDPKQDPHAQPIPPAPFPTAEV